MITYLVAFLCVIALAGGQILFKITASELAAAGTFLAPRVLRPFALALAVYGTSTIGWVWVLQKIELGRVYPLMALGFVFVPLGGYVFLGERFQPQYFVGIALIALGIVVTLRA